MSTLKLSTKTISLGMLIAVGGMGCPGDPAVAPVSPPLSIWPTSGDFGLVEVGSTWQRSILVYNPNPFPISLSTARMFDPRAFTLSPSSGTIAATSSITL